MRTLEARLLLEPALEENALVPRGFLFLDDDGAVLAVEVEGMLALDARYLREGDAVIVRVEDAEPFPRVRSLTPVSVTGAAA